MKVKRQYEPMLPLFTQRRTRRASSLRYNGWKLSYRRGCMLLSLVGLMLFVRSRLLHQRSSSTFGHSFLRQSNVVFPPSSNELARLNARLTDADAILRWAYQTCGTKLVQVTSFGPSGLVVLHKLHQLGLLSKVDLITIDTLHLFSESYTFFQTIQGQYPEMSLSIYRPLDSESRQEFEDQHGVDFWKTNPDQFSYLTKVEPMMRALDDHDVRAWITGRRRSQGGQRAQLQPIEVDPYDPQTRIKVNPLVHWSYQQVWDYIHKHDIPYNPLYDQGYKSLGDSMTTEKVESDASERSGRFVGLNKTECGMHSHLEKVQRMRDEAAAANRQFEIPTLPCNDCLEVGSATFDADVLHGTTDMLLEFYSPLCGGCLQFSPKYNQLAAILKPIPEITVARFDITEDDIPDSGIKAGLDVQITPSLFLVTRTPFSTTLYPGAHNVDSILQWLAQQTSYVHASRLQ